ncbi:MAG: hypothetical protein GQ547_08385 [Methylophaga sp.]|nr:hypothetical protein [Methylophaga sp.]
MRKIVKLGSVIAVSVMLAGGLTACGGGGMFTRDKAKTDAEIVLGQEGRTLWESGLQYAKIVDHDVAGITNDHPLAISSDELRTVLSSLYITQKSFISKNKELPLFSRAELQTLSVAIANGLSQADSSEDINFVSIGSHKGVIAKERKTITGRVFMSEGRLNIVFGLVHELFREKDIATGQEIDRRIHPLSPGTRKSEARMPIRVALDSGQSFYLDPETGKERADWLVIDIATVLAEAKKRKTGDTSSVTPELLEDIAQSKQDAGNLREDVGGIKEILFEMSDEIERLKQQIEELKAKP